MLFKYLTNRTISTDASKNRHSSKVCAVQFCFGCGFLFLTAKATVFQGLSTENQQYLNVDSLGKNSSYPPQTHRGKQTEDVFLTIKALTGRRHRQKLVRYGYQKACKNLTLAQLQGSIAVKEIKSIKRKGREQEQTAFISASFGAGVYNAEAWSFQMFIHILPNYIYLNK